jgi:hypothetical protein
MSPRLARSLIVMVRATKEVRILDRLTRFPVRVETAIGWSEQLTVRRQPEGGAVVPCQEDHVVPYLRDDAMSLKPHQYLVVRINARQS